MRLSLSGLYRKIFSLVIVFAFFCVAFLLVFDYVDFGVSGIEEDVVDSLKVNRSSITYLAGGRLSIGEVLFEYKGEEMVLQRNCSMFQRSEVCGRDLFYENVVRRFVYVCHYFLKRRIEANQVETIWRADVANCCDVVWVFKVDGRFIVMYCRM